MASFLSINIYLFIYFNYIYPISSQAIVYRNMNKINIELDFHWDVSLNPFFGTCFEDLLV